MNNDMDLPTQAYFEGLGLIIIGAILLVVGDVYSWANVTTFGVTIGGLGGGMLRLRNDPTSK